ncbi:MULTISPECIES: cell division protein SepF [Anaerofustis]|uniref:cell division protein SepF n=1 Tax=Anaerofustis TaxID=264995 RepID=UPI001106E98D|nr:MULTISPECIES: cell division protein SepF [Anaerofustis]MCO8193909.1 cell division protein SepF [Anaerofustis sp. NSJ-163]
MGFNDFIGELGEKIVGKDEYYEDEYYEDEYYEDEPKRGGLFGKKSSSRNDNAPVATHAASTVMLIEPRNFNDAPLVCDKLKGGITVVVNMDKVENDDAKKIFDFLSGAVYVLAASMKRIAQNVFILAPYGVEVETQERPNDSYTTSHKDTWEYEG